MRLNELEQEFTHHLEHDENPVASGTEILLLADPECDAPEQRATVLEYQKRADVYMVEIAPADRLPGDRDGLTEVGRDQFRVLPGNGGA